MDRVRELEEKIAELEKELQKSRIYNACVYGTSHPEIKICTHEQALKSEKELSDELFEALKAIDIRTGESPDDWRDDIRFLAEEALTLYNELRKREV